MTPQTVKALQVICQALQTIITEESSGAKRAAMLNKGAPFNMVKLRNGLTASGVLDASGEAPSTALRLKAGREWCRLIKALRLPSTEPLRLQADAALRELDIWFEDSTSNYGRTFFKNAHMDDACPWHGSRPSTAYEAPDNEGY